ncbi:hypothetical protein IQ07DRAFT_597652 [Pyrenochaeta sp. DS3sAY3a]|nr:hypothetical protein IQ07DRAFT_597652 [Pyrenochaeta sp. DS3sAY3a]
MKVFEPNSDRKAEVYLQITGKPYPVQEYGHYVDPETKALCCYVPLSLGDELEIGGNFEGTTVTVAYEAVVDGVVRKAVSTTTQTVKHQKKKIKTNTFLLLTEKGTVYAAMFVEPLTNTQLFEGDGYETIGTIELRLYVTRRLHVSHSASASASGRMAYNAVDQSNDAANYRKIRPTLQMGFKQNGVVPLDESEAKREDNKLKSERPGTEPWAIIRFHYRNRDKEVWKEHGLKWQPSTAVPLELPSAPPLPIGMRVFSAKSAGDSLLRGSVLREKLSLEAEAPQQGRSREPPRKDGPLFVSEYASSSEGDSQDKNDDGIFGGTVEQPTAPVHHEDSAILRDVANSTATSIETSKRPMSRPADSPPPPKRTKPMSAPDTPHETSLGEQSAEAPLVVDGRLEAEQAALDKEIKRYKVSQDELSKSNEQFNDRD